MNDDQFLSNLERSNLLGIEQMAELRRELAGDSGTVDSLRAARWLVAKNWLTKWQAEMLWSGRHAFFLGRNKLLDHLGRGGMGDVFKAEQLPLGRVVALKLMSKELLNDEGAVARFHREIQAAAALLHPNIVTAYDADCVHGTHFLSMEYVEGEDVAKLLEQAKRFPVESACEIARQTALGLQHAMDRNMVHRDIKPSNLLLTSTERGPAVVKILDMGLARFSSEVAEAGEITKTGQVMGTPDYISPEQASDTHSADTRSDLFSLGCTLFRMLTGEYAYEGQSVMAKLMARGTKAARRVSEVLPDVTPELDDYVAKMLAREPDDRPQTPADVAAALAQFSQPIVRPLAIPVAAVVGDENKNAIEHDVTAMEFSEASVSQSMTRMDNQLDAFLGLLDTRADETDHTNEQTILEGMDSNVNGDDAWQPTVTDATSSVKRRKKADRNLTAWIAGALVIVAIGVGYGIMSLSAADTTVVLDWPEDQRSGEIEVDGVKRAVPKSGELRFTNSRTTRKVRVFRDGYETIELELSLVAGETRSVTPTWRPLESTVRRTAWAKLKAAANEVAKRGEADTVTARDDDAAQVLENITRFSAEWPGTNEFNEVPKTLAKLPSWLDAFDGDGLDDAQPIVTDGFGGSTSKIDVKVVARLGDGRRHAARVYEAKLSPDESLLATASDDHSVKLWDTKTGNEVRRLLLNSPPTTLAFHPTKPWLLTANVSGSSVTLLTMWNYKTGEQIWKTDARFATPYFCDISSDGKFVATGIADEIAIRTADTGEEIRHWDAALGWAHRGEFSPNGKGLVTGGLGTRIKLWSVPNGELLASTTLIDEDRVIRAVRFNRDGSKLIAGSDFGDVIVVLNADTLEVDRKIRTSGGVIDLALSADEKQLLQTDNGGHLIVHDLVADEPPAEVLAEPTALTSVVVSSAGDWIATTDWHGRIHFWKPKTFERLHASTVDSILHVVVSPNGRLIVGTSTYDIYIWDLDKPNEPRTIRAHSQTIWDVAFSPTGDRLVTASGDQTTRVWDVHSGKRLLSIRNHDETHVTLVRFLDADRVLSAGDDKMIRIWNVKDGEELSRFKIGFDHARGIAFGKKNTTCFVTDREERMRWFSIESGKSHGIQKFKGRSVATSRDGELLAFGQATKHGGSLMLWTIDAAKPPRELYFHQFHYVDAVAISPDRSWVASCGHDGTIRLSDITQPIPILDAVIRFAQLGGRCSDLTFSPDSRHLIAAMGTGEVLVYRIGK